MGLNHRGSAGFLVGARKGYAHMYMPYLMCGYAATVILMLAGCYAFSRTVPGLKGLRLLAWALAFGLLGVSLLALRPVAPAWITILVANGAVLLCSLVMYFATAEILEVRDSFCAWGFGILVVAVVGLGYFTYVHEHLVARIFICTGGFAVYAVARAWVLFAWREPLINPDESGFALGWLVTTLARLQVVIVLLQFGRIVLTALYPPTEIVHMDIIQSGFTYLNLMLNAGAGFGLIWLAQGLHRRDLHHIAQTDGMTGLLNRRAAEEILARELHRRQLAGESVSILLMDIDRFKDVNDTYGHQSGDEVIRRVALALQNHLRPSDPVSRFGGEEFLILLRDASISHAEEVAGRLRANIAGILDFPDGIRLTVSVGVAESRLSDTPETLLRRCDEALYLSKRCGRNRVTVDQSLPVAVEAGRGCMAPG